MLINKDCRDKNNCTYKCDRCNTIMTVTQRKIISVGDYLTTPRKRWDLCPRCFKALVRGIEGIKE